MRIGWGYRIIILYCSFAAMMVGLVVRSSMEDFNLVSKDYYADAVNYQDHINQINNSKTLAVPLAVKATDGNVQVAFPGMDTVSGEIKFYRPADSTKDKVVKVNPDENNAQLISTTGMDRGNWKVQISWVCNGKEYFDERAVYIN